jgi:hypothetical protein
MCGSGNCWLATHGHPVNHDQPGCFGYVLWDADGDLRHVPMGEGDSKKTSPSVVNGQAVVTAVEEWNATARQVSTPVLSSPEEEPSPIPCDSKDCLASICFDAMAALCRR